MPTSTDVGGARPGRLVAAPALVDVGVDVPPSWSAADLTKDWPATAGASAVAILPALLLSKLPLVVALAVAVAIACGFAIWAGRNRPEPLVLSLVPATILANSGLLPAPTYYLPTAILGLGLVIYGVASIARSRSIPDLPPRPLIACAVLYVIAAVVSTVFSIRPATSVPYVVGIVIILIVTLWLGPWVLSSSTRIASLFALVGAAGIAMTLLCLVFSVTGPVLLFGRWLGVYLVEELTLNGQPTGITVLRTTGPFLAPGSQALALVPAILALLALRPRLGRRGQRVNVLALVILTAGLLSTFTRAGWIAIVVGSAFLTLQQVRTRRIDIAAGAVCVVTAFAFGALYMNVIGADYRPDLTAARISNNGSIDVNPAGEGAIDAVPVIPDAVGPGGSPDGSVPRFQARGGSELSGRLDIWSASIRAIRDSPWVGYGPGTNAIVLDPYLTGVSRRFVGLSSHNTWLRTWIEFGILGIVAFLGFVIAVLIVAARREPTSPDRRAIRVGALAIFLGLLAAQGFETFLLGGVSMPSLVWSMTAGVLVMGAGGSTTQGPVAT